MSRVKRSAFRAVAAGFSLVELLLVLGVMACLIVSSFVIYPQVNAANKANNIVQTLRDVRAGAASGDWARETARKTGVDMLVVSAKQESLAVSVRVNSTLCARLAAPLVGEGWAVAIDGRSVATGQGEQAVIDECRLNPDRAERTLLASVAPISSPSVQEPAQAESLSPQDLIWKGVDGF